MAFKLGAFAAGFATKAQEIEEESAKIGIELLKEAMDDFREEAKDYKPRYQEEIRVKKEIAKALSAKLENVANKDIIIKQIMDNGDIYAKEFIQKAEDVAKKRGVTVASLMPIAEANKEITGFSIEDYINSGGYSTVKEPLYVAPTDLLKTGVFGRDISLGTGAESIRSAYIPERGKFEGDVPTIGQGESLSMQERKGAFVEPTDTQVARLRKNAFDQLSAAMGISTVVDRDTGELKYNFAQIEDETKVKGDAFKIVRDLIEENRKADTAIRPLADVSAANDFALANIDFYTSARSAAGLESSSPPPPPPPEETINTGGEGGRDSDSPEGPLIPREDPRIAKLIKGDMGTRQKNSNRRVVVGMLMASPYNYSEVKAEAEALALIPK